MKFRGAIFLLGGILLVGALFAQNSGQENLPSAPSAVQEQLNKPKPAPPAPAKPQPPTAIPPIRRLRLKSKPSAAPNSASTQSPVSAEDDSGATITKTVNEVNVVFTVTDKHGRYVRNLAKADFSVLDDNRPAEPSQFS